MLSKQDFIDIEEKFLNSNSGMYLVLNRVNGKTVDSIFTSHSDAKKYLTREVLNMTISWYNGVIEDEGKDSIKKEDFNTVMKDNLELYEIIDISDLQLNIAKPIYVYQNGNYQVLGSIPEQYLTNDYEKWKNHEVIKKHLTSIKWKSICTVKINPKISEIESDRDEEDD